ncbi:MULTISPECIES: hypothetical protein [unclassified Rhizobium]|uniref:hypothetical protein n=1 Tax=unclassified Rhizobium TaxID=2613769 RepID=UPI001ADAC5BF|nr:MULTISPECIES: hypothetical protein [unclassified Rhizobium]MBO9122794.1 hypothetical protein [Rhizobium sp. 16-488-2b]MBO9173326.1 hypothetical protein [Rhizobium sp. 16-488-2a]
MADNLPALPPGFVLDTGAAPAPKPAQGETGELMGHAPAGGDSTPELPPGFEMEPVGRHLNWEESQRLLDRDEQSGASGAFGAFTSGGVEGFPIVGPAIMGGIKRAAAGLGSLINGDSYDSNLERADQIVTDAQEQHPVARIAGNITGGVAAMAPVASTALGARALGVAGETLAGRSIAGLASGGVIGGTDAAVRSEGDWTKIAQGAGLGMLFGGAGPAVGSAIGAGTRGVLNWVRSRGDSVGRNLATSLTADGIDAASARARLAELGPEGMPADLGPNMQGDLSAIASMPGRGQTVARAALAERAAGAGQRIRTDADASLGPSGDIIADRAAYVQERADAARPLYQQAYAEPFQPTQTIRNILQTPAGRQALRNAQRLAENERMPINPDQLDVRGLDLVKRSLDDQIGVAQRAGRNNEVRMLSTMRNHLINDAPDSYRAALDAFAGPSAVIDALDNGRSVFQRSVHPGEVAAEMRALGPGERDAYLHGARAGLDEIMMNARNDGGAARAMFQKDANRFKLQALLGRDEADRFLSAIEREATFADTGHAVTGNSVTAARTAAQQRWGGQRGDGNGVVRGVLNMNFGDALASAGGKLNQVQNEAAMAARRGAAADILTSRGPDAVDQLERLSFLQALQGQNARIGAEAGTAAQIGAQAAPTLTRQLLERR